MQLLHMHCWATTMDWMAGDTNNALWTDAASVSIDLQSGKFAQRVVGESIYHVDAFIPSAHRTPWGRHSNH